MRKLQRAVEGMQVLDSVAAYPRLAALMLSVVLNLGAKST